MAYDPIVHIITLSMAGTILDRGLKPLFEFLKTVDPKELHHTDPAALITQEIPAQSRHDLNQERRFLLFG